MSTMEIRRTVEARLEINAPVDAVWKALTDARELARWFPIQARVRPGAGGGIWISWGQPFEGESEIRIWEPNSRLQTGWPFTATPDSDKAMLIVDYHLESRAGKTLLRLVHSGFGVGGGWDAEYDGVTRGWGFELRGLKHYLENHPGIDRHAVWVRRPTKLKAEEAIARIIGPSGRVFRGPIDDLREGNPYRFVVVGGDTEVAGIVAMNLRPRSFCGNVPSMNNAFFRCDIERIGTGEEAWVWFSTYGLDSATTDRLQRHLNEAVTDALPD